MDEEDERRKKKKKDFVYSRRRCLSRDNSYTSKDGKGLVSKVSLNSCQRGCRHRFPVDKAASARCGCSNDHLIRERKNERENKRVSRLGSMLRKKKKKRGGDRKKKKKHFHPSNISDTLFSRSPPLFHKKQGEDIVDPFHERLSYRRTIANQTQ